MTLDRFDRLDRLDRTDRLGRLHRVGRLDNLDRTDRFDRLHRADRFDRLDGWNGLIDSCMMVRERSIFSLRFPQREISSVAASLCLRRPHALLNAL